MTIQDLYDYDEIAKQFNQDLITKLRQHGTTVSFLELWVPDSDPVLGILGMFDAARTSGIKELSVTCSCTTLPVASAEQLSAMLDDFGQVKIQPFGVDQLLIHVTDLMSKEVSESDLDNNHRLLSKKLNEWSVERLGGQLTREKRGWKVDHSVPFGDVNPHLREALKLLTENHEHRAQQHSKGIDNRYIEHLHFTGKSDKSELKMSIDPSTETVSTAEFKCNDTDATCAALDLFCRLSIGMPIREVADHVGLKVLSKVSKSAGDRSVKGILLPKNAGEPFSTGPKLARKIYNQYAEAQSSTLSINFFRQKPPESWLVMDNNAREIKVRSILTKFVKTNNLNQGDIVLERIEKDKHGEYLRGILSFGSNIATKEKPNFIRLFEKKARTSLGVELDFVVERLKDTSPLRRLTDET